MKVYVNAGHHENDSGAVVCSIAENETTMRIRDELKRLPIEYELIYVPDSLDLGDSITWINRQASSTDLALDIHLNTNKDKTIRGVEAYYSDDPRNAQIFARKVAEYLITPNRGAIHDGQSYVKSLGFLRKTVCPAVVLECGYMTSEHDKKALFSQDGLNRVAKGIIEAIKMIGFHAPSAHAELQKQLNLIARMIETIKRQIAKRHGA